MAKKVNRFKVNRSYRRMDGKMVTVLECCDDHRGYEVVRCSDTSENSPTGIHRYNRTTHSLDQGRVTGTSHDFSDPRNLDPRQIGIALPKDYRSHMAISTDVLDRLMGCDDRCASKRGYPCNCAMAAFSR